MADKLQCFRGEMYAMCANDWISMPGLIRLTKKYTHSHKQSHIHTSGVSKLILDKGKSKQTDCGG